MHSVLIATGLHTELELMRHSAEKGQPYDMRQTQHTEAKTDSIQKGQPYDMRQTQHTEAKTDGIQKGQP